MPLIENAQGVQQLPPEHRAAAAVVGQRGQRLDDWKVSLHSPVVAFDAPHGDQQRRRHAIPAAHRADQLAVLREHALPFLDSTRRYDAGEVASEVEREFRLIAVACDDRLERREAGERRVEGCGGDACGDRFGAKSVQPVVEGALLGASAGQLRQRAGGKQRQDAEIGAMVGHAARRGSTKT